MSLLPDPVSDRRLAECHPLLKQLLLSVANLHSFRIVCAHRCQSDQDAAFARGASKKKWPDSLHNRKPSLAVDLAPLPELYGRDDRERRAAPCNFGFMAGIVYAHAQALDISIRWGGDWDMDLTTSDESFKDLGHFELLLPPDQPTV